MKNILLYRLFILNTVALIWLGVTDYNSHWFRKLVAYDTTYTVWAVIGLWVFAFIMTWYWGWAINKDNRTYLVDGGYHTETPNREKNIEIIYNSYEWMFLLGLIGTLLGLSTAVDGIDLSALGSLEGIQRVGSQFISGLKIELACAIVSGILGLWAYVNHTILKKAILNPSKWVNR